MANTTSRSAIGSTFNVEDYVDAANDAATSTRTVTIVLVVASVLISIGWYNSLLWSWPVERVRMAFDPAEAGIFRGLDVEHRPLLKPDIENQKDVKYIDNGWHSPADNYRMMLQWSVSRAYVENVRFVRVPFFGIAFDVNDLGVIGGTGLITILLMMRFCLSREIKNLKISFREAQHHNKLCLFYHKLAMRQVFTVPHMKGERRNRLLALAPKLICITPAIIFSLGVFYDYYTVFSPVRQFEFRKVSSTIVIESVWLFLIWLLARRCWERQGHINAIWQRYWKRLKGLKSSVVMIEEDLVEEFGSDDQVNSALRELCSQRSEKLGSAEA